MRDYNEKIRARAKALLEDGTVQVIFGWEKGTPWYKSMPVFIKKAADCDRLIFNEFCYHNLAKYFLDYRKLEGKIGVFVKGCDSRSLVTMIQDHQIERDQLYILGLPCEGLKEEPADGAASDVTLIDAQKCTFCTAPNPVIYDELLGEEVPARTANEDALLKEVEGMSQDDKYAFWYDKFSQCLRCFACRDVCPVCSCRKCCFDDQSIWLAKGNEAPDNMFYHLTRALHMAGRCVGCGECERVCPMGLPVQLLNRKLNGDISALFPEGQPGMDLDTPSSMNVFSLNDKEEFM